MTPPADRRYTKTHEWVAVQGDTATIGITSFAVELLSDLVNIDLPKPGKRIVQGEPFGEIESVKHVSDLYAPVTGEVVESHAGLSDHLDELTSDAFGKGWLIKVRLSEPAQLNGLLDVTAYTAHCEAESAH